MYRLPSQGSSQTKFKPKVARPGARKPTAGPSSASQQQQRQQQPPKVKVALAGPQVPTENEPTVAASQAEPGPRPPASRPSVTPGQDVSTITGNGTNTDEPMAPPAVSSAPPKVSSTPASTIEQEATAPSIAIDAATGPTPTDPRAQIPSDHDQDIPRVSAASSSSSRPRQGSVAPSGITSISSINRSGRPALIQAAAAAASAGQSSSGPARPSPGRIPSRRAGSTTTTRSNVNGMRDSVTPAPVFTPVAESSHATPSTPVVSTTTTLDDLPPSFGGTSAVTQDDDLPPSIGMSRSHPPPSASVGHSAPQEAGGGSVSTSEAGTGTKRPRARGKRKAADEVALENGETADNADGDEPESSQAAQKRGRKKNQPAVRRPTRVRRRAFLNAEGEDQSTQQSFDITKKRVTYGSRGKAGTQADKRLGVNKKKEDKLSVPSNITALDEVQPGEHVGERVNDEVLTMAALATYATSGKVTSRAIQLHQHRKELKNGSNRERPKRIEDAWRRKQVQRRKLRAERNAQRAERRKAIEEGGNQPGEFVSEDEEDSEEEYEVQPEWLRDLDMEEDIRRGRQAREPRTDDIGHRPENQNGEGINYDDLELELGLDEDMDHGLDNDMQSNEDENDAALRASGFFVTQDGERGENGQGDEYGQEREGEEGEGDVADWDADASGMSYDIDAYRREIEDRRRRNIERALGRGVVEENEELKMVNSATYGKRQKPEKWTTEDTDLFYVALSEVGATPSYLREYFRGRTHRQLKSKLNREMELDPVRFNEAINKRKRPDAAYLNENRGIDLSTPHEVEEELFESAARGKVNARRRDMGLPDEEDGAITGQDGDGDGDGDGEFEARLAGTGEVMPDLDMDAEENDE